MIRTNQRPMLETVFQGMSMLEAVLLGLGLLAAVVLQGCQHRRPVGAHDKIEAHGKIARSEQHSVHDKLREVFFGEERTVVWGHHITIESCRNAVKQTLSDNGPLDSHHLIKCGATKVEVVNEELRVNEKSYGKLAEKAPVQIADGKVFINGSEAQPVAQVAQK